RRNSAEQEPAGHKASLPMTYDDECRAQGEAILSEKLATSFGGRSLNQLSLAELEHLKDDLQRRASDAEREDENDFLADEEADYSAALNIVEKRLFDARQNGHVTFIFRKQS